MRKLFASLAVAAARVLPMAATTPSPAAASILKGRPVEYYGVVADLNTWGYIVDHVDAGNGGVIVDWRDARTGVVTTYHVAHARVVLDLATGRLVIKL
jgi:hypothetical protein